MKKLIAVLLSLSMLLTLSAAAAASYTAGDYYTVDYPETMTVDDESYTDENTEDDLWLFMLVGDDYLIDAGLTTVEVYEGFSLYNATDAQKADYIAEALETFADSNPSLVDIVDSQSDIPFYIYSLEDSDGMYYYAETISNGVSVYFCCYYYDAETLPDATLLRNLESVLTSFRPAGTDA